MNKPLFYISCPFDTYSGYGARSRDIVKSIIELDKYEVKLLSQNGEIHLGGFVMIMKHGNFYMIILFLIYHKVFNLIFGCK